MNLFINRKPNEIDEKRLSHTIQEMLAHFGKSGKDIGIIYVDNKTILDMNIHYLGVEDYTDVIAFNLEDDLGDNLLGEIYVSAEQAKIQAPNFGSDYIHELIRLTVHGVLHILGYEDDTSQKKQIMHRQEDIWIEKYFA